MTLEQIFGLGVRCLSIFAALHSIKYLIGIPAGMANTNLAGQVYVSYGFGALCLMVALLFWCFPMALAKRIVPKASFGNRLNLQAFDAARVGASLIGLWLFANAMSGVL
ncbi:MAG: hypothetical protein WBK51_04330 [Polaromonas sp.]